MPRPSLFCAALLVCIAATDPCIAQVVITEVQPAPPGTEPEWVEIENVGPKAVTITDWQICDDRTCSAIPTARLNAGQRAVLTKDPAALRALHAIPEDARVLEVSLPSLNNTTDAVVLRDANLVLVDSMLYDLADYSPPKSIERIGESWQGASQYALRWTSCIDREGSTPGRRNSALVLEDDVGIVSLGAGDDGLGVVLQNLGRTTAIDVQLEYVVTRQGTTASAKHQATVQVLGPSARSEVQIPLAELGWPAFWGTVEVAVAIRRLDDRTENDTATLIVNTPPPTGTITLNEIMFDPLSTGTDYVELVNTGLDTIDVGGWIIEDEVQTQGSIPVGIVMAPGSYLVVANSVTVQEMMDSGVPAVLTHAVNLNSTGDRIVVRTASGFRVDEVTYTDDWHVGVLSSSKGLALEKISPCLVSNSRASWTTSTHPKGGTPGSENSVSMAVDVPTKLAASPSPFSSDPRSLRHPTVIGFTQPYLHAVARMTVATPDGRMIADLLNGALIGARGGAVWDGRDRNGLPVQPGPYVVILECVDATSQNVHSATAVVVVGE